MNHRAAIKNDILISIQPEYADQIMDGCKTVELRRRFVETVDQGARLFIYSSNPVGAIIGCARIDKVIKLPVKQIWKKFHKQACIEKSEFEKYFDGIEFGFVVSLGNVTALTELLVREDILNRWGIRPPSRTCISPQKLRRRYLTASMKFLLDTNIILGIEDNRPIDSTFSLLARKCSEHGIKLFIDSAVIDDVKRDKDEARKQITLSKLEKFEILRPASRSIIDKISSETSPALRPNDESDIRILAAVSANAVDFLVTEDFGLHRLARRADLSDRVLTVADALKFVAQKFDPSEVILPFIKEVKAYEIDRNADIFETLREDYDGFDAWFEDKCARQHRDCWVVEVGAEIAGLLIPKEEAESIPMQVYLAVKY